MRRHLKGVQIAAGRTAPKDGADVQCAACLYSGERERVVGFAHKILLLSNLGQKKTATAFFKRQLQSSMSIVFFSRPSRCGERGRLRPSLLPFLPNLLRPNLLRPRILPYFIITGHRCIVGVFPNDFRLLTSYHVFQNAESAVSTLYDLMICMIFLNTSSESVFFNELPDHLVKLKYKRIRQPLIR